MGRTIAGLWAVGAVVLGTATLLLAQAAGGGEQGKPEAHEAIDRKQAEKNLAKIARAFHYYHDRFKSLPRHAVYSKDGKTPLLSWRVTLLLYLALSG
jgi:Protein of unknown function (DUF1559)